MNEEKLYQEIWQWVRELKIKYKHDEIVKIKATYWSFAGRFQDYDSNEISACLKKLVDSERIKTNFFDEEVFPFDAYILPSNF